MTIGARWTKHRPIALAIARDFRVPGLDPDDVRQEALVALWMACREYDRDRGPFPPFARLVVRRRMADLLEHAARQKRTARVAYEVDPPAPDQSEGREQLRLVVGALDTLTDRERAAVRDHLNGRAATSSKAHETALWRARRKLKAAA